MCGHTPRVTAHLVPIIFRSSQATDWAEGAEFGSSCLQMDTQHKSCCQPISIIKLSSGCLRAQDRQTGRKGKNKHAAPKRLGICSCTDSLANVARTTLGLKITLFCKFWSPNSRSQFFSLSFGEDCHAHMLMAFGLSETRDQPLRSQFSSLISPSSSKLTYDGTATATAPAELDIDHPSRETACKLTRPPAAIAVMTRRSCRRSRWTSPRISSPQLGTDLYRLKPKNSWTRKR